MADKTFLTISQEECRHEYKRIIEHSNILWEDAKKLVESTNRYGTGAYLSIVSVEELIKALIVYFDGLGFQFRSVPGMAKLFNDHRIRYFIAYFMFAYSLFGDELRKFLILAKEHPDRFLKLHQLSKEKEGVFERWIGAYGKKKLDELRKEFEWFSKIDIFRQDSLYCDYQDFLKNPINVKFEEYEGLIQRLQKVRSTTLGIIEAFDSSDKLLQSQVRRFQKEFKEKDYYSAMAQSLESLKGGKDPFKLVFDKLKNAFT